MTAFDDVKRIAESYGWNPRKQPIAEFVETRLSTRKALRAAARELVLCDALAHLDRYYSNGKLRDRHSAAVVNLRIAACGEPDLYKAARLVDPTTVDHAAEAWKARKEQKK